MGNMTTAGQPIWLLTNFRGVITIKSIIIHQLTCSHYLNQRSTCLNRKSKWPTWLTAKLEGQILQMPYQETAMEEVEGSIGNHHSGKNENYKLSISSRENSTKSFDHSGTTQNKLKTVKVTNISSSISNEDILHTHLRLLLVITIQPTFLAILAKKNIKNQNIFFYPHSDPRTSSKITQSEVNVTVRSCFNQNLWTCSI